MANKEANCEHILNTFCILQAIHGSSQRCLKDYSTIARSLSHYNNTDHWSLTRNGLGDIEPFERLLMLPGMGLQQ